MKRIITHLKSGKFTAFGINKESKFEKAINLKYIKSMNMMLFLSAKSKILRLERERERVRGRVDING